jgi:hypothetical protein
VSPVPRPALRHPGRRSRGKLSSHAFEVRFPAPTAPTRAAAARRAGRWAACWALSEPRGHPVRHGRSWSCGAATRCAGCWLVSVPRATLIKVETLTDDAAHQVLTTLQGDELVTRTLRQGSYPREPSPVTSIPAGQTALLLLDDVYDDRGAIAPAVMHRVEASFAPPALTSARSPGCIPLGVPVPNGRAAAIRHMLQGAPAAVVARMLENVDGQWLIKKSMLTRLGMDVNEPGGLGELPDAALNVVTRPSSRPSKPSRSPSPPEIDSQRRGGDHQVTGPLAARRPGSGAGRHSQWRGGQSIVATTAPTTSSRSSSAETSQGSRPSRSRGDAARSPQGRFMRPPFAQAPPWTGRRPRTPCPPGR